jgi:vancomycin resistance protein VanW
VSCYARRLIDYPGQEQAARTKRANQAVLAAHLAEIIIEPGEVFSIWRLAPRPTRRRGYGEAAGLRDGRLRMETGGAICLLSTVLYNVALLGGLRIIERHCHSVDTYGEGRYFELGREAAIEYGYRDLRFSNPHDFAVLLHIEPGEEALEASLYAAAPVCLKVDITVDEPEVRVLDGGERVLRVKAFRTMRLADGEAAVERLPDTLHRLPGSESQ